MTTKVDFSDIWYVDTRGVDSRRLRAIETILEGTTSSGGLWVIEYVIPFSIGETELMRNMNHIEVTYMVLERLGFIGEYGIPADDAMNLIVKGYEKFYGYNPFDIQRFGKGNNYLNFLFHGRTMAFKDYALALLGEFASYLLKQKGLKGIAPGATSGDTGPAAMANVASDSLNVSILYSLGGTSFGQEKQMIYYSNDFAQSFAMQGKDFDACQSDVKEVFADKAFLNEMLSTGVKLFSINSINWFRIAVQTAYMFYCSLHHGFYQDLPLRYSIPVGNSGHWIGAYFARQLGAPIYDIDLATNANDILSQLVNNGRHYPGTTVQTLAPAMDITVSSNLERFLFSQFGADQTKEWMIGEKGSFQLEREDKFIPIIRSQISAFSVTDEQIKGQIARFYRDYNIIIDPHTATACSLPDFCEGNYAENTMYISTAHPMKFLDTIQEVLGKDAVQKVLASIPDEQSKILAMSESELTSRRILGDFGADGFKDIIRNIY